MDAKGKKINLDSQIDIARNQLVRARIFLDIWWYYHGFPTRKNSLDAQNEFPEFFKYDEHAHWSAFIVHIATLYDKPKDKISLPKIFRALQKSYAIPNVKHVEIDGLMKSASITAEKIFILRHNIFAHRSDILKYDDAFKKANLTYEELLLHTEKSKLILNLFLEITGRGQVDFWELPRNDLSKMLNLLKPKIETK